MCKHTLDALPVLLAVRAKCERAQNCESDFLPSHFSEHLKKSENFRNSEKYVFFYVILNFKWGGKSVKTLSSFLLKIRGFIFQEYCEYIPIYSQWNIYHDIS